MGTPHFTQGMRGLSLRLSAALKASGPLGDSLTKGEMREEEIIDAFRPHIPQRYDLVKGTVITSDGQESDPQDIILVDTSLIAPAFGRGRTKAVPIESVVGVIQVKSGANSKNAKSAVKNIASAKVLMPEFPRFGSTIAGSGSPGTWATSAAFFGGVIFLEMDAKRVSTVSNAYAEATLELPLRQRCDAMCVLDEFSILWSDDYEAEEPGIRFSFRGEQADRLILVHAKLDSVLFFYLSLAEHINNWITPPMSWLNYVDLHGFEYQYWE